MADLSTYADRLRSGALPVEAEEQIGAHELVTERIFLGLRGSGVDFAVLRRDFGYDLAAHQGDKLRWLLTEKRAVLEGGALRLTSKGYLLCDEISGTLFQ